MAHDQCPSTTKGENKKPSREELEALRRGAGGVPGRRLWRSAEEFAGAPEFDEWLHREFPAGASELAGQSGSETRRTFLKLVGASMALAGAAMVPGCRRPDHKILAYSKNVPEDIIPGKPLYYATSMARPDGGAEGLLVETHEGRPTKIEGNPLHPTSRGKSSAWAQASILSLYDPDRLKEPRSEVPATIRLEPTWDTFREWAKDHFAPYASGGGDGLAVLCGKVSSPSLAGQREALRRAYPRARFVAYSATDTTSMVEGTRAAFGAPMRECLNITKAGTRVIVALDRDFLYHEADEVMNARAFAAARQVLGVKDDMVRLYVAESGHSVTGAQADHRVRLAPSRIAGFAVELARFILPKLAQPGAESVTRALADVKVPDGADMSEGEVSARRVLEECAKDLLAPENRGKSLVVAGPSLPAPVHALVIALNSALGNIGASVGYRPMSEEDATDSGAALAGLAKAMNDGAVRTLVCMGVNPLYDAPGSTGFADAWKKVRTTITLSVDATETAAASTWSLNGAHFLESWGDTIASDGTVAPVQPMIAPLYEPAMSELEFTALLAGKDFGAKIDGYAILRASWQKLLGGMDVDRKLRRALHDGIVVGSGTPATAPAVRFDGVAGVLAGLRVGEAPTAQGLEVSFAVGHPQDGRYANISWLQELPEVGTRTVWDNPALISPATAEALSLTPLAYSRETPSNVYDVPRYPEAAVADLKLNGRTVRIPVWILPGMADNVVQLTVGYGRETCGLVGDGVGVNVYPLREAGAWSGRGASLSATGERHMIASTQNHWSMAGRTSIVRVVDLPAWQKHGESVREAMDTFYANGDKVGKLNFAEQLGELSHTPPNLSIYVNPYNRSLGDADPKNIEPGNPDGPAYQRNTAPVFAKGPQWGMTIDLNTCTGCGACTIACQAENNIPVVGKKETAKGREMTWIRVDRYFTGEDMDSPGAMLHQPVACVQCENAPCEVVCPVNATTHGPEGINYMVYNRCIGTRYCANNCPYKVRRFNFFDYGVTKFNGAYTGKDLVESIAPDRGGITGSGRHTKVNPNLIPPRVRDKLDEISRMQKNPDVTVRSRGVMEKCTYCIQRINYAKIETKLNGLEGIPDGFFQTACQQACPSDSIVFGDILDTKSRVSGTRSHARSYSLLGFLNTRPRTSHMVRIMNPNPQLCDAARKAAWEHPFHHSEGGEGGGGGSGEGTHAFRYDRGRKSEDRGYALSLRVLKGAGVGGNA